MNDQPCTDAPDSRSDRPGINQADWESFCRDADHSHFRPLYEHSRALVWTICRRILRDPDDAQDAMQSTYCRLLHVARQTDPPPATLPIRALVSRLAVREANNLRLRRSRHWAREVAVDVSLDLLRSDDRARSEREARILREQVEVLVEALPDRYRVPVLLHYFDGLSHREVAEALGTPVSTVSNRIARAHRQLEPMLRRAGLGTALSLLAIVHAHAALLKSPARLTAERVFAIASRPLAGRLTGSAIPRSLAKAGRKGFLHASTSSLVTLLLLSMVAVFLTMNAWHGGSDANAQPVSPSYTVASGTPSDTCH